MGHERHWLLIEKSVEQRYALPVGGQQVTLALEVKTGKRRASCKLLITVHEAKYDCQNCGPISVNLKLDCLATGSTAPNQPLECTYPWALSSGYLLMLKKMSVFFCDFHFLVYRSV